MDNEIPKLFGLEEFAQIIREKLGIPETKEEKKKFDRRSMSMHQKRGKLPPPVTTVGTRSFWTKDQVENYATQYARGRLEKGFGQEKGVKNLGEN